MFLYVSVILFTGWGWYPSMPCRWYPSMPCSRSLGGVSRPTPRGNVRGLALGDPHPPGPHLGGSPGRYPGGSPGPHSGGSPGPHLVRDPSMQTPPPLTATAADGTHPTGMHSCFLYHQIGLHDYQCNCSHMTTEKTHPCRQVRTDPLGLVINTAMHRRIDTYSQKTSIIS